MYTICPSCQFRTAQNKKMCGACGFVRAKNVANPLQEIYESQPTTGDIDWAATQQAAQTAARNAAKAATNAAEVILTAALVSFKRVREVYRAMRKRAAEVLADVPVDRR
jgi:hypothetical protein